MKTIAFTNLKGGVGKTTSAINFSGALSERGYHTLLVDLDPQANATSGIGGKKDGGVLDLLQGKNPSEIIKNSSFKNLDYISGGTRLATFEFLEEISILKEETLKQALLKLHNVYDFVIIDVPPSLGQLLINGLVASDGIVVPVQSEFFAMEGLVQLSYVFRQVKKYLNPNISFDGVLLTMFDKRNALSYQVEKELNKKFEDNIFSTKIYKNVRLAEAPSHAKPINFYDKKSVGSQCYGDFCEEYLKKFDLYRKDCGKKIC